MCGPFRKMTAGLRQYGNGTGKENILKVIRLRLAICRSSHKGIWCHCDDNDFIKGGREDEQIHVGQRGGKTN